MTVVGFREVMVTSGWRWRSSLPLLQFSLLVVQVSLSMPQTIYPDGGRNVIKIIPAKPTRIIPYNDGSVMAHVIGSAGMNFLYYFHILGVSCENNDPEFYKIIQTDFEFCLNKTGPLPAEVRNDPLGSIPKPCYDWKIRRPCYKNLADDYDECLAGRPGLVKKGTDALRFTHAYAKFICGNMADTEAHLLDRFTKHDLIVNGVFQCFPHLQDRINNCVKRDRVSKTLCSKFFIVHACFGKYYNDDNCPDVQPIYYMDDLFRNMSTSLNCPKSENEWMNNNPPSPSVPPHHGGSGSNGWSSKEEHGGGGRQRPNHWPGEVGVGRPWSSEKGREPYVRGGGWGKGQGHEHGHSHSHSHGHGHGHHNQNEFGWDSAERGRGRERDRERLIDPHAHRPLPDAHWNSKPSWVADRRHWDRDGSPNAIDSTTSLRGSGRHRPPVTYGGGYGGTTRVPSRGSGSYAPPSYSSKGGGRYQSVALPPAGFAITKTPHETMVGGHQRQRPRFYSTRESPLSSTSGEEDNDNENEDNVKDKEDDNLGYDFYSFD